MTKGGSEALNFRDSIIMFSGFEFQLHYSPEVWHGVGLVESSDFISNGAVILDAMSIKWENLRKPFVLCIFFIDSMYHVCNSQDGSKKYSFRSNQNMGFIKEDQLNTIMNGYCFCIWCWSWSHQEKNIREERWIWSGGEQGQRIILKDELGPFSLPQSSHYNDVSVLRERKGQHAGLLPHVSVGGSR